MTIDCDEYIKLAEDRIAQQGRMLAALREALKGTREQLTKARDALGRGHALEVECSLHIGRAWHALNFDGQPATSLVTSQTRGSPDA